jgi:hypothetical protein
MKEFAASLAAVVALILVISATIPVAFFIMKQLCKWLNL